MKSKTELEQAIINITMKINQEFPELTKYIKEMPVKISGKDNEDVENKNLVEYHNSLVELLEKYSKTHAGKNVKSETDASIPMEYPASDDIYNKGKQEMEINPNDLSKNKTPNVEDGLLNEKDFKDDMSGDDLDVPGSELDDKQESVGSEDEENNYYSLGGDNHNDLDEDKG